MGFKAYHLIESINKYSVIQFPIMTIQISDDSHIKNVLRTSNYEHADQYNIKLAAKTYPLKSNKNKEHPMNPNPPHKKKKPIKHHLIKKENRKNSKDPEKLTTVIDKGRHEQRLIIQKKQNPNNASEAQNPSHRTVVVVIVIIRKTKLKSI